jgi:hypothetical protein
VSDETEQEEREVAQWRLTSTSPEQDHGTVRTDKSGAVAAAKAKAADVGRPVYVQKEGAEFVPARPTGQGR